MINDDEWRELLQDIVEVLSQLDVSGNEKLEYVTKRARRALAEEQQKDAGKPQA